MHPPVPGPTFPFLEVGASADEAEFSVILMHGLGADGHDFADVAEALCRAALPRQWRFVLPHAPDMAVTINMGMRMPSWYDILDLAHPRSVNWVTVEESRSGIEAILDNERAEKLVLAGFSQGAALALHVGLRRQKDIAGILVMSGYLLESEEHLVPAPVGEMPIGIFHGREDTVVPISEAERTSQALGATGYSPMFKAYPGLEHSVGEEEVRDVFDWLQRVQPKLADD